MQRQEISEEEDEPVQGKMIGTVQRQEIPEEEPLQKKSENNTGMPDSLKAGVENLSGIDMSNVRVHYNSSKPAEVGALAYTQGINIHVAPGQERHLPHEAWHVVQQVQGRVRPTMKMKGLGINDDPSMEHEADMMGAKTDIHVAPGQERHLPHEAWRVIQQRGECGNSILQGVFFVSRINPPQVDVQPLVSELDTITTTINSVGAPQSASRFGSMALSQNRYRLSVDDTIARLGRKAPLEERAAFDAQNVGTINRIITKVINGATLGVKFVQPQPQAAVMPQADMKKPTFGDILYTLRRDPALNMNPIGSSVEVDSYQSAQFPHLFAHISRQMSPSAIEDATRAAEVGDLQKSPHIAFVRAREKVYVAGNTGEKAMSISAAVAVKKKLEQLDRLGIPKRYAFKNVGAKSPSNQVSPDRVEHAEMTLIGREMQKPKDRRMPILELSGTKLDCLDCHAAVIAFNRTMAVAEGFSIKSSGYQTGSWDNWEKPQWLKDSPHALQEYSRVKALLTQQPSKPIQ
jgi:hypothetical protein